MSFAINPVFPVIAASGATASSLLQPGTTISAQVLQQLDANRVRIAIPNMTIEVLSEVPLQPGQILQLAVSQTPQGVRLQIVPQQNDGAAPNTPSTTPANAEVTIVDIISTSKPAPSPASTNALVSTATDATLLDILETAPKTGATPNAGGAASADPGVDVTGNVRVDTPTAAAAAGRPLTNLEALAVSAAVQTAAAKQGSLAPLFANLSAAMASGHCLRLCNRQLRSCCRCGRSSTKISAAKI